MLSVCRLLTGYHFRLSSTKLPKGILRGEIDIEEVRELIKTYYQSKSNREPDDDEKQEADGASANISKILSNDTLDFSTKGYIALHRRIFTGIFKHAGRHSDYNITNKERGSDNETVNCLNWEDLRRSLLDYGIEQECNFSYKGITPDAMIAHITRFVSGLWQIHPFGEENTRTTAVFTTISRSISFNVSNKPFAQHSWYFRNTLVLYQKI